MIIYNIQTGQWTHTFSRVAVISDQAYSLKMKKSCSTSLDRQRKTCRATLWERVLEYFGFITDKTVYNLLRKIHMNVEEIKQQLADATAVLTEITPIVSNVAGDVDSLLAQIAALIAELAAGKVATQEDLDAIGAGAQTIKDGLTSMKDALSAVDAKEPA